MTNLEPRYALSKYLPRSAESFKQLDEYTYSSTTSHPPSLTELVYPKYIHQACGYWSRLRFTHERTATTPADLTSG
jgi:hypothetical protein